MMRSYRSFLDNFFNGGISVTSRGQVLIAVDFENLGGCAREDVELRRHSPFSVLKAIASEIEQVVAAQYPQYEIAFKITAFSSAESDPIDAVRYRARAMEELGRRGYRVEVVTRRPNAADEAITTFATALLYDRAIKACVLATQDSGSDFVEFLQTTSRRTRVHLIGWTYVPDTFQTGGALPYSLIRDRIARTLEDTCPRTVPSYDSTGPRPANLPPPVPIPVHTVRQSTRAFLNNPSSLTNAEHYALIRQALIALQKVAQEKWQGTLPQLCRELKRQWQGPTPPNDALWDILQVIGDQFFYRRSALVYRPEQMSSFLRKYYEFIL